VAVYLIWVLREKDIYISDGDPGQETLKDEGRVLPSDLEWLEELYE